MPEIDIRVEINFVTETSTALQTQEEEHFADDEVFQLVDRHQFIKLFRQQFPRSLINPDELWNNLFGNHSYGGETTVNPHFHYLTRHSCEKIFQHIPLFKSGIDFQHLPAGFFLAKNPAGSGVCDVLHYSEYVATYQQNIGPLSITLSDKTREAPLEFPSQFEGHQAEWYQFLQQKRIGADGTIYCSQQELQNAFIYFSNIIQKLGLNFYSCQFDSRYLIDDLNPIVLLGRWETTLTQRHLKKTDVMTQWQTLPLLPVAKSSEAIRAITDFENEESPCGFICPAMELTEDEFDLNGQGFRTIDRFKLINDEKSFWRYVAYQPKRNSMNFYQQAIAKINSMTFEISHGDKWLMYQILAASTTRSNHLAESFTEEAEELATWHSLCELIDTIESATPTLRLISTRIIPGSFKHNLLSHFHRLVEQPNIQFLDSMVRHITDFIKALTLAGVFFDLSSGRDSLEPLVELSDKLSQLIAYHESNYYQGAKFYLHQGAWNTLNVQTYTELQHYFYAHDRNKSKLLAQYLSTFNIKDPADIDTICQLFIHHEHKDLLPFCLSVLNDIQRNDGLTKNHLLDLINYIQTHHFNASPFLELLDYMAEQFPAHFEQGYFAKRKQQLIDASSGLTPAQMDMVRRCRFLPDQQQAIFEIESELVRRDRQMTNNDLNHLNEQLVNLRNIIIPEDFTLFTARLASLRKQFPKTHQPISKLISLLVKKRTLEDFSQIFMRNKVEQCRDEQLIDKFILFIEQVKRLSLEKLAVDRTALQETLATIVLNTNDSANNEHFLAQIKTLVEHINSIATAHPHIAHYLLESFNHIPNKFEENYPSHVRDYGQAIFLLSQILTPGEDEIGKENMLTIYSLLAYFHKKPTELTNIFAQISQLTAPDQQHFMLTFVSRLLDNNQSINGLDALLQQFMTNPEKFALVASTCTRPPLPDVPTLLRWLEKSQLSDKYAEFSMQPYGLRRIDYAFNSSKYSVQASQFIGVKPSKLFNQQLGYIIDQQLKANRQATVASLREEFDALRSTSKSRPLNDEELLKQLCLSIEILARTTAQYDDSIPPSLISQELNATQVMALYAMLVNPGNKLISEIDTGEGKSRIMMLLAACKAAQGKTVDFITSNMQLAERDYLSYKQFFTTIGIRTSLISLSTPKQLYQKGGVNFSDNSQLLLLRNKSDIEGEPFAYLDEQAHQRCLLIDEVDKFKHDKSKDAYNYAAKSKKLTGFVWIYPYLVEFMQQELSATNDAIPQPNLLVEKFLQYVQNHDTNMFHQASLAELKRKNPTQITTWLQSGYLALLMEKDKHYKMTEADESKLYAVRDIEGHTRYTRKILVLDNGRPAEGSSFSEGVHQCLCAKENITSGAEEFVILPENETLRSSYPVAFMSSYQEGSLYGVSGTTRSAGPRAKEKINYEQYNYLIVPREKKLIREDNNTWVAKDQDQQIEFIKRAIAEKLKQGRPALLICKDDNQSHELSQALEADKNFMRLVHKFQRVHGLTSSNDEGEAIQKAGLPRVLTISTAGMFGRGVDINSANLFVAAAYVPTLEDDKQIRGRTARAGKPGEYRMFLNLKDPDTQLNGKTYNIDNEVEKLQKERALSAVFREEVSKLYALFLEDITQNFLRGFYACAGNQRHALLLNWQVFLGNMQKDWGTQVNQLLQLVEAENKDDFKVLFNSFTTKWIALAPSHLYSKEATVLGDKKITEIYDGLLSQKSFFVPKRQPIKVQRRYDPADDGQARVYSSFFAREIATLKGERRWFADYHAWREGRGDLFPDLMAVLRGERCLFANLIATIKRWINEWRQPVQPAAPQVLEPELQTNSENDINTDDFLEGFTAH